jgi:hypothetical protein
MEGALGSTGGELLRTLVHPSFQSINLGFCTPEPISASVASGESNEVNLPRDELESRRQSQNFNIMTKHESQNAPWTQGLWGTAAWQRRCRCARVFAQPRGHLLPPCGLTDASRFLICVSPPTVQAQVTPIQSCPWPPPPPFVCCSHTMRGLGLPSFFPPPPPAPLILREPALRSGAPHQLFPPG